MADTKNATPKAKRAKSTTKGEWKGRDGAKFASAKESGPVASRAVDSVYGPEKQPIKYTERKLHGVSDPAKALDLLGLKSAKAVAAIVFGANFLARKAAATNSQLAAKIEEAKGTTMEEELKYLTR